MLHKDIILAVIGMKKEQQYRQMEKNHAGRFSQMSLQVPVIFQGAPEIQYFFYLESPSRLTACSRHMILWYSKRHSHIKLFATPVYCENLGFLKLFCP